MPRYEAGSGKNERDLFSSTATPQKEDYLAIETLCVRETIALAHDTNIYIELFT